MENLDELRDRAKKEKGSYYILMQFANPLDIAFEYGSEYGFEEPRKMQTEVSDIFVFEVDVEKNYRMLYYEAGYAVAKGKDLILCCKDGENPHFDVAQINTIFWKDEQSLKDKLVRRIRATIRVNE